jgi:hypothetical protein
MPDVYFAPFLLLLVAGASVAAGETRHLWCLALAAGFLVHGHAEFLLFAPVIGAAAMAALVIGHGGGRLAAFRAHGADWLTAAGVSALFLLPIGIDLALHWPGEFGKYLSYSSNHVGGHSLGAAWSYTAHFWSGRRNGYVLWGGVVVAAGVLAARHRTATVRRFLLGCLAISGLATLLFVFYTVRGVDYLEPYIGYFYWAVPLTVILVTVIGAVDLVRATRASAGAMVLTAAVVTGLAMRGPGLENTYGGAPQLPALTRSLASLRTSTAQPLVLDIDHDTWPDAVAILVQADRVGVHACMADRFWTFMVTKEFVCAPAESASGLHLRLRNPAPGTRNVVATMLRSQVTLAGSSS